MTIVVTELYVALRAAGAPEDKARKAAEVAHREFSGIKSDLRMVKWLQAATLAMTVAILAMLCIP